MNIKFLSLVVLLTVFFSCKKTQEENTSTADEDNTKQELSKNDISKLNFVDYILDEKTETSIESWQEYTELNDVVVNIKDGDLSYFNDNDEGIKTLFKNLKIKIPKTVETPSIIARIVALETKFYKLKSFSGLSTTSKEELNAVIKEFLESFSYLNLQMNKKIENDSNNTEKPQ